MKRLILLLLVILSMPRSVSWAQGGTECEPAAVQEWLRQRQTWRTKSQQVLDAQGVTPTSALMQLAAHLQAIEDLPRPACADDAMLWTYYLYTNLQHLLICAQGDDSACVKEMQGRLTDYRQRDEQIMSALASGVGLPAEALLPPTPTPAPQTKRLGPIWDDLYDETYNVEISMSNVRFEKGAGFDQARTGHVFVIVDVEIRNLGPDAIRSISGFDFQVRDANGALRDSTYVSSAYDCSIEMVDLVNGGSISGCVAFEVPETGSLDLIYAPYRYEGLVEGRYLSFRLR